MESRKNKGRRTKKEDQERGPTKESTQNKNKNEEQRETKEFTRRDWKRCSLPLVAAAAASASMTVWAAKVGKSVAGDGVAAGCPSWVSSSLRFLGMRFLVPASPDGGSLVRGRRTRCLTDSGDAHPRLQRSSLSETKEESHDFSESEKVVNHLKMNHLKVILNHPTVL